MPTRVSPENLRIIGRDLELRGIHAFFIRCESSLYVVEAGYQSPPAPTAITLHYTLDDIGQLEEDARYRTDHLSTIRDFLRFSDILWAAGTYVTGRGGRLLTVSNSASTANLAVVTIEYDTDHGERVVDRFTGAAVYELGVSVYKLRETSHIKDVRYTRFSALQHDN